MKPFPDILRAITSGEAEAIDLNQRSLGRDEIKSLAQALTGNATLRELYLGRTRLDDTDVACLAEALKANTGLREIYLGKNNITDVGAAALAQAIAGNAALEKITLWHNPIGRAGCEALAEALRYNRTLTAILGLSNENNDLIKAALEKWPRLKDRASARAEAEKALPRVFAAELWAGKLPEMRNTWEKVPDDLKNTFDFAAAYLAAQMATLAARKPVAPKLRRKS